MGGGCYKTDPQGLLQAVSAETQKPSRSALTALHRLPDRPAVAPVGPQAYDSTQPRLGRKELAIRLSWKKGKLHLTTMCHLEGLRLFMFLAKDPLQGNI